MEDEIKHQVTELHESLREDQSLIAVAESCTGGLLGGSITSVAGSSDVFAGGVISYSNEVKNTLLDVSKNDLDENGAVSSEVAEAMATGVAQRIDSTSSVSITGIAGPTGGTPDKPVGLVYVGLYYEGDTAVKKLNLDGTREEIRVYTVQNALRLTNDFLNGKIGPGT